MQLPGNSVWAINASRPGAWCTDLDAIAQRIAITLNTIPGTVPLQPLYGCNILQWVDAPTTIAGPNIKNAILEALTLWVPDITVKKITYEQDATGYIRYNIGYEVADAQLSIEAVYKGGVFSFVALTPSLILVGKVPSGNVTYTPVLQLNSSTIVCADGPFDNVDDLYNWVATNWGNYGTWGKLADGIVLYAHQIYKIGEITYTHSYSGIFGSIFSSEFD
jgi:phage baseplate assembly protein W